MHTELSRKLLQIQAVHSWTQQTLADYAGVTQPTINALTQGTRASHRVLQGICQHTPRDIGAEIMLAHLSDEIRAGGYTSNEIVVGVGRLAAIPADELRMRLDRIARVARRRKDIAAMLGWLADVVEALEAYQAPDQAPAETTEPEPLPAVAESLADYQVRKTDPRNVSKMRRAKSEKGQKNTETQVL